MQQLRQQVMQLQAEKLALEEKIATDAQEAEKAQRLAAEAKRRAQFNSVRGVFDDIMGKVRTCSGVGTAYVEIPITLHSSCEEVSRYLMPDSPIQYDLSSMTAVFYAQAGQADSLGFQIKLTKLGANLLNRRGLPAEVTFQSLKPAAKEVQIAEHSQQWELRQHAPIKRQRHANGPSDDVLEDAHVMCAVGFTFVGYNIKGSHLPLPVRQLLALKNGRRNAVTEAQLPADVESKISNDAILAAARAA